jgi:hypothetical protein
LPNDKVAMLRPFASTIALHVITLPALRSDHGEPVV